MSPVPPQSAAGAAPLPPLPNLSSGGAKPDDGGGAQSSMAQLLSGVAPIKTAVDSIVQSCQQIVKSGMIPGAEQVCGQIVALAASLLPMAVQQSLVPGQAQPPQGIQPLGQS